MLRSNREKVRKTPKNQRNNYKYEYLNGQVHELNSGENGINEYYIELQHKFDDSEVYYNNKNLRPKRTPEEKMIIAQWKQNFINKFIETHGYEPNDEYVNYEVNQAFPRNYNLSINNDEIDFDKSNMGLATASHDSEDFEWSDKMTEIMKKLTDKQRKVIELMFVEGLKQNEVAEVLGVSAVAVNKHFKKAKEIIKKYF